MKIMGYEPKAEVKHTYHVEQWYNRSARSWVTQIKDEQGNQTGEAQYDGHRAAAVVAKIQMTKEAAKLNEEA